VTLPEAVLMPIAYWLISESAANWRRMEPDIALSLASCVELRFSVATGSLDDPPPSNIDVHAGSARSDIARSVIRANTLIELQLVYCLQAAIVLKCRPGT